MKKFTFKNNCLQISSLNALENSLLASSKLVTSRMIALKLLSSFCVHTYVKTRNSLNGSVSHLSVYVEHGLLNINDFLEHITSSQSLDKAEPLLRQIFWREFFVQTYEHESATIWEDFEPYKTGYSAAHYAQELPEDIVNGQTNIPLIDILVKELQESGYLHNHARLYLASYIIHHRHIAWQAGAKWMLRHLNDGNIGVNNLSWQWVASTRSNKPYIFNWENIEKFASEKYKLKRKDHLIFDASYEQLQERLFLKDTLHV